MSYIGNTPLTQAQWNAYNHTVTATTTYTIPGGYTPGFLIVILNGSMLQSSDFTASNGTSVVLNSATKVGDSLTTISLGTFETASLAPTSVQASHLDIPEIQGAGLLPTAWCRFNGVTAGTNAPSAGYNVTSVTRVGTGDYTITFTDAMDNTNYIVTGATLNTSNSNVYPNTTVVGSTGLQVRRCDNNALVDIGDIVVVIFGGKN